MGRGGREELRPELGTGESSARSVDQTEAVGVTEAEYETIFETVEDAVFVFDVDHAGDGVSFSFRQNNSAHEAITDITVDAFYGESPEAMLGPAVGAEVAANFRRCVESREPIEYEESLEHATGTVEWHTKLTPITDGETVIRLVGVARDITERKARARELERKQNQLRALFEEAPDGIVVHDVAGQVLDVNDTLCEHLGYTREELLSMAVFDFDVGIDRAQTRSEWESMEPESMQRLEVDGLHRRKDGSTFPVEVWVSKVRSSGDDLDRFVALVRDVTDRNARERELEQYERIVESASDALWMFRDDFSETLFINQPYGEIFGQPPTSLEDDPLAFINAVHPDDRAAMRQEVERISGGKSVDFEVRVNPREDFSRWVWIKGEPVYDDDGSQCAVAGFIRDITDTKRQQRTIQQFKEAIEQAAHAVYITDTEGTIEYVNPAFEAITGYTEAEAMGETPSLLKSGEHDDDLYATLWETILDGRRWHGEMVDRRKDGERIVLGQTISPLTNDAGEVEKFVAVAKDITDQKAYERRLNALHEATRRIVDAESKAEVAAITVDAASDLLDFSLPTVWYPSADGASLTLAANTPAHQSLLESAGTPDPTHLSDSWLWDVIESGETVVKSPLPTADLAADVPLQSAITLPLGEHGVLGCGAEGEIEFSDREIQVAEILGGNVRAALDQLEQRAALERQRAFTDDLLDAIEDVVYVLDTDGNFEAWNVALEAVTGYHAEAIDSMNVADFFSATAAETVAEAVESCFETGRTRIELELQTASGDTVPYEFIARTFEDPTGESVMAGIGRDRSVHVEYEETLEAQRDNLKLLNQVVRHDIRNDMTVVKGRADLLEDHIDESGREHFEAVVDATENAISLTKTARDLAESMLHTEADVESVPLDRHLRPSLDNARSTFDHAVITVEDHIPSTPVRGNELLEAVFRNLVHNAVIHTDKSTPDVTISTSTDAETVTVAVADNGPGIPDDRKEVVFGKGEKGLDSPGTGIGLYLVRTLVEQYGGTVWVEDNDPEGSVFFVELPRGE